MRIAAALVASGAATFAAFGGGILTDDGTPDPTYPTFYAWFDAADGVNGPGAPADGAAVTSWQDRTGQNRDLVRVSGAADERPTFRMDAINGLPAVSFDGNDYIWGDQFGEFGSIAGPKTVFFVTSVDSADGGYVFDGVTGSQRNAAFTGQIADPSRWHLYAGNDPVTVGPFVAPQTPQVHAVAFADGANAHWINGEQVGSGDAPMAPLGGLILGSRFNVTFRLDGDIAEVLVYDAWLDDAERAAVEGYLLEKHPPVDTPVFPEVVDVFVSGDGVYPVYRIPSIVRTQQDTLLAFAEGRATLGDNAENDIVVRRSTDGGDTWSAVQVIHDDGPNSLNNPCALEVREGPHAGRVLLMYQRYPDGCHEQCVPPGYDDPNICRGFIVHSDDDGITWSDPLEITTQVKRPTVATSIAGGPGIGIQKRRAPDTGRLVMPFNQGPFGNWKVYAVYSDDGGDSWTWGELADDSQTPGLGNEVQMAELVDGQLMLNSRSAGGTQHRKVATSADGGLTWTPLADDLELIEPGVMASILRLADPIDGFTTPRLLYAGPNSTSARVNGTVHLSYDEGDTWPIARTIYPGSYAYSVLTVIDCERIGVLFERDNHAAISLARFSLDWLTDGADTLAGEGPCPPACPADLDDDGTVGGSDLGLLLGAWNSPGPGDLDGSGNVDGADLGLLLATWGPCPR